MTLYSYVKRKDYTAFNWDILRGLIKMANFFFVGLNNLFFMANIIIAAGFINW